MEVAVCRSLVVQLLPLLFQLLMEHSRIQQRGTPSRHFRSCRHNSSLGPPSVNPQGLQTTLVSDSSAKVSADNNSDTSTTPSVINVETASGTGKEEHDSKIGYHCWMSWRPINSRTLTPGPRRLHGNHGETIYSSKEPHAGRAGKNPRWFPHAWLWCYPSSEAGSGGKGST